MTLIHTLELDILPSDLHAKIQKDVKTITPDTSQTWGVITMDWIVYQPDIRVIYKIVGQIVNPVNPLFL